MNPAALLVLRHEGRVAWGYAGLDPALGRPPELQDRWRVASVTKPFVAAVVLQLVAEGRLGLDDEVATHLPGLLPESLHIRVRQLLQHTSGLADYHDYDGLETAADFDTRRAADPGARECIELALAHSPVSAPGTEYHYTDTNYRVLELLVETLTAQPLAGELERRILTPLELRHTDYTAGTPGIGGTHLHGYMPSDLADQPFGDESRLIDYSEQTLDQTGGAGALVSNAPDVSRFLSTLLGGELIEPALLEQMLTTVDVDAESAALGIEGAGLGIERWDPGCGTRWGHGGSTRGYTTLALASDDGLDSVVLAITQDPLPLAAYEPALRALASAACR